MRLNAVGRGRLALPLAAAMLVTACGSHSSGTDQPAAATAKAITRKAANPGDQLSPYMVGAVASNKPSLVPVQVKFELHDRPSIGQPLDVDLAIVPMSASVDQVAGKIEADDGLELVEGGDIPATEHPAEGVPIRHALKVVPRREGIFTVRASVTVQAAGSSSTETWSIPVIAAAPAENSTAPGAAAAAPATAAASRPAKAP